MEMTQYHK